MFWINIGIAGLDNYVLGGKVDYYHHQAIINIPPADLFHEIKSDFRNVQLLTSQRFENFAT